MPDWPEPQYPPVQCPDCNVVVPEAEACWGYCATCFDQIEDLDFDG